MYILILLLPLISFMQSTGFGFILGRQLSSYFTILLMTLAFLLSCFIFYEVGLLGVVSHQTLYSWLNLGLFSIKFGLLFDSLTSTMLIVITTISLFVHIYSVEYMSHDPYLNRFLGYLSLFTFFMIVLVTSDNFVQLFMGWEGVGLCSYLLINFWFTRILANKAAIKAMLVNRIADVFFVISIYLIILYYGTTDYTIVFNLIKCNEVIFYVGSTSYDLVHLLCFFLIFGAIGKSAQIGFHTWLPDAMEGPTPVSSLLHAATMVTAGVFLILRCCPIFEKAPFFLGIIAIFGGITAIFAAFIAAFQWDIKKIIAYSTCSQLGYMFVSCGFSFYSVAIFHLFNHAFFKALLFLSAGSVIHALSDEQDIRKMGGLLKFLPFTFVCMLFGSLSIMGFPFLTGFYSKDLILELIFSSYIVNGFFLYSLTLLAAFFTALYSIRLLIIVFLDKANFYFKEIPVEPGFFMTLSLLFLVIASIFAGFLFSDLFVGLGSDFWGSSFHTYIQNVQYLTVMKLTPLTKNLPLIFSMLGVVISITLTYFWKFKSKIRVLNFASEWWYCYVSKLAAFFYNAGFFNIVYNNIFYHIFKISYEHHTKLFDKALFEVLGPIGLYRFAYDLSNKLRKFPYNISLNIGFMLFGLFILYVFTFFLSISLSFALNLWPFFIVAFILICKEVSL